MKFPFFKSNKGKSTVENRPRSHFVSVGPKSNAVVKQYGPNATENAVKVGFPSTDTITPEDIRFYRDRDPQAFRIIKKYSADPFKKGVDIKTDNDNWREEWEDIATYLLPALETGLEMALTDGYGLIYINFKDSGSPESEIKNAQDFSDMQKVDFSFIRKDKVKSWKKNLDPTSPDHNKIESYVILVKERESDQPQEKVIHASRIIHMDYNSRPGERTGTPILLPSHDLFMTKKNFEYGAGEGWWRHGTPLNVLHMPFDADDTEWDEAQLNINHINAHTGFLCPTDRENEKVYQFEQFTGQPADMAPMMAYLKQFLTSMPETQLLGVTAGTVAGSETNVEVYFDDIINIQQKLIKGIIEDFLYLLDEVRLLKSFPSDELLEVTFPPLLEMSEKEKAAMNLQKANAAVKLLGSEKQGIPPLATLEEVRQLLYSGELDDTIPPELVDIWEREVYSEPEEEPEQPGFPPQAPEFPFGESTHAHVQQKVNKLPDSERIKLTDEWVYPQDMDELRLKSKILPIFAEDIQEFKDKVEGEFKEFNIEAKTNQPPEGAIEAFIKRILKIKFNDKQMTKAMTAEMLKVFDSSVEFTFDAIGLNAYTLGSETTSDYLYNRASANTWKFYENLSQSVKWEMADGVSKGEGVAKLKRRLQDVAQRKGYDLERMVRTVTKEAAVQGKLKTYEELGIDRVVFIATMDERTCPECMALDGLVFNREDAPYIPVHIQCGCGLIPESSYPGGWKKGEVLT